MIAPLPSNEMERLQALTETGLLDSHPDDEFDSLVRLASVICGTPISLITLVDENRQWFKANIGLDATETDRDIAFCAHTILGTKLFLVPDASKDPRFAENPLVIQHPGIRFYAGIPLETSDGLRMGSLCVIDRAPRILTEHQTQALHLLALQANKLINLRRQQKALEVTIAEGSLVEQELRANQGLFHAFMDNSPFVGFMKDAEGRMVYYNSRFAERFRINRQAWLGKNDSQLWPPEIASALRANDLSVLHEWKTHIFEEVADDGGVGPTEWRSYKFPFKDSEGREYVAGFAVDITADKQARKQIESYQKALEEANEQLLLLAVTDSLTDLSNRRAFEGALDRELAIARRYNRPLSLLLLDVDNFKLFNDTFGHEEGDRVLKGVASVVARSFRITDFVARYGGEEFAVILPNTTKQSAMESAERLRLAVGNFELDDHQITVSVGVSTLESDSWSKSEFVRRADSALYRAKHEGKNRVCLCQTDPAGEMRLSLNRSAPVETLPL